MYIPLKFLLSRVYIAGIRYQRIRFIFGQKLHLAAFWQYLWHINYWVFFSYIYLDSFFYKARVFSVNLVFSFAMKYINSWRNCNCSVSAKNSGQAKSASHFLRRHFCTEIPGALVAVQPAVSCTVGKKAKIRCHPLNTHVTPC